MDKNIGGLGRLRFYGHYKLSASAAIKTVPDRLKELEHPLKRAGASATATELFLQTTAVLMKKCPFL